MPSLAAVIPARGGSRSIPDKNIHPLLGRPLLAYTVEAALGAEVAERVVVSTDSPRIAAVARELGAEVLERPAEISGDTASTESALLHALDVLATGGFAPAFVLTLQPTSPLRSAGSVRRFVAAYEAVADRFDAMLSVTEDRAFKWVRGGDESLSPLFPGSPRRRQDRSPLYSEDSALYISRVEALRATGSIFGRSAAGFVLDPLEAVDVNEPADLAWAEFLLRRRSEAPHGA